MIMLITYILVPHEFFIIIKFYAMINKCQLLTNVTATENDLHEVQVNNSGGTIYLING